MLKGINPILSPELLAILRAMGHGDEIAIVDGNYPALENARRLIRLDGMNLVPVIDAILSVLPVDDFTDQALFRSTVGENPEELHDIHQTMLIVLHIKIYLFLFVPCYSFRILVIELFLVRGCKPYFM